MSQTAIKILAVTAAVIFADVRRCDIACEDKYKREKMCDALEKLNTAQNKSENSGD